jgi:hypothetical protein
VVEVDVDVAAGVDRHVDHAVLRKRLEHVIEKTDAGVYVEFAAAVEVDDQFDISLTGLAMNIRFSQLFAPC